ncbi:MAG TPA: acyl-CoA reductase [Candidatus Eisenbacteria bacterium]|nr:acyl-CoA reductase [Candidatus Eisenbacteria bacterium]
MNPAFYLPLGLEEGLETTVQRFGPAHEALDLHLPVVQNEDLLHWIEVLREARETNLAHRPIQEIVRSLDKVTRRFLDKKDTARREAVESLAAFGRFTTAMLDRSLDDAFQPLAHNGLNRWIVTELGSVPVLDRPAEGARGTIRRARGPEWMLQIYAGNVPTLPVWPIYSALILKSALLGKTSAREPLFAPLLARTIAEVDEKLGACLAVVWWKGGTGGLDRTALSAAPAVLAFGGEEAVGSVARQAVTGAHVVLHGPKVSVGYVERRGLTFAGIRSLAARAAHDVSMYDQDGCLSPHAFYVERRGQVSPEKFGEALAAALEEASKDLPPVVAEQEEAAGVQLARAQARFESAGIATVTRVLESPGSTAWTVIVDDRARFEPGPTRRTIRVHAVDGPDEVARVLAPSARSIEALGLEARGPERVKLAARFADLGIPRIAPIGSLQNPVPWDTHGGVPRLLPFVTWTTVEHATSTSVGSRTPGAIRRRLGAAGIRRR